MGTGAGLPVVVVTPANVPKAVAQEPAAFSDLKLAPFRTDVIWALAAPAQIRSDSRIRDVMFEQFEMLQMVREQSMTQT